MVTHEPDIAQFAKRILYSVMAQFEKTTRFGRDRERQKL